MMLSVVRREVKRDNRNIDPPSRRKGGKLLLPLIGHRGTNWKRRRWHLENETKTCLFRVLYLCCTTLLLLTIVQGQDSLHCA